MEIHLQKGIGEVRFGMTRAEVEKVIGKPDVEKLDSEDPNELIWEFNDLKLRLTFYENENHRMVYIRGSHANMSLNKHVFIDQKIDKVLSQIDSDLEAWEVDDQDLFTAYFNEKNWFSFNVEYQRITDFEMGVPLDSEESYLWPK
ncbi:MAG: hypothetical protein ACJAZH_001660 [Roseivirga sp.]|jgi:hypothetical protein